MSDPEPQPGDGPDYHTEHAFWLERQRLRSVAVRPGESKREGLAE